MSITGLIIFIIRDRIFVSKSIHISMSAWGSLGSAINFLQSLVLQMRCASESGFLTFLSSSALAVCFTLGFLLGEDVGEARVPVPGGERVGFVLKPLDYSMLSIIIIKTMSMESQLESMYRKEQMLAQKVVYEKQCIGCKIGAGLLFGGMAGFHAFRVTSIWKMFPLKEKVFNLFAVGLLGTFSAFNLTQAKHIWLGKEMQLVEYRPSVSERLTSGV